MRRRWIGAAAAAAAAAGASAALTDGGSSGGPALAQTSAATAEVERRDLVDRETVSGTLQYADAGPLLAGVAGTLTDLRPEGATVRRGQWLYEVDGRRSGWLLYGRRPTWRDLGPAATRGHDVRQLERNLAALGYQPGVADGEWTAATTAAVRGFQDDRALRVDGTLSQGELVFRPGRVRVGGSKAVIGARVGPGVELGTLASTRREVAVDLPADRQELARRGERVVVDLPDGLRIRGRIAEVGAVAVAAGEDGTPTVDVLIGLRGRAARRSGLDQAPVDVGFEVRRARDALVVPVTALLARPGGAFAVELAGSGGRLRMVEVQPGLHADGLVEVEGDLRPGDRVAVPS